MTVRANATIPIGEHMMEDRIAGTSVARSLILEALSLLDPRHHASAAAHLRDALQALSNPLAPSRPEQPISQIPQPCTATKKGAP